ncbi:BREX-2 system adenine-specific DNA-methyltransferase PglX [Acidovorax sp. SUPP2522]|uniref:BREX-2 system adenine-specific DNA-methyltransferase PglX n=1 Tax=unclassified Acidovorax TaxID=2684926 RepID=UPI00234A0264|nr:MULTISPECIES: BREX-2 system adenine-specific DNA-methyltransferase PglX [unclassified Acidovorax]WCM99519.1 BREX-2 system adenine-specific DNA-methyltransferase PglX [Acidovorax sp. GBBC 1281]GKT17160.1 BREX-2 system adenine-specific DNA-methyltransferase PglX [Acidovorax sp. SUPP2522]
MINAPQLLSDLTRLLKRLEGDLLQRIEEVPELKTSLQAEWQAARDADRCAETFETWADQVITQAGVHWLLSCVFLRFIEDNQLVDRPWLGGTPDSGRLALVRDRHDAYFQANPLQNDRDYLLAAFREAGALPGLRTFFDEAHNPAFRLGISGDAAMALMKFWWEVDADTGALKHDFTDLAWNTRFLGDLYQDLSEATRKRYALLQTPEFVEEFILDRTLTPAIREFGYREARLIDPTCGSGHFLLGGFHRLLAEWQRNEPGRNPVDMAQKALDAVAGVDLNPFAVAISRFRLFVAALQASGVQRLANAHDFKVSVAIGDSLLHGTRFGLTQSQDLFDAAESHADTGLAHAYASEDLTEVQRILGRQYHAVVGNPPYIVVKDAALNVAYRRKYASCHMKYSLGAPFTERFFELAVTAAAGSNAGYVGLITANSFMKREFGSKLIEQVLPRLDLTHVVDTSGAYIPGHGTPTVILFGRHRSAVSEVVRTVMGIKGEPSTPADPAQGLVWGAIVGQIDRAGSESDFISVVDTSRTTLAKYPWSIGGGGASDVKEKIELDRGLLAQAVQSIGITSFTLEDEAFVNSSEVVKRAGVDQSLLRIFLTGEELRDWNSSPENVALFPYAVDFRAVDLPSHQGAYRWLWRFRTSLSNNKMFGKQTKVEAGLKWWEYGRLTASKLREPFSIAFAFVATHNHFVLDRGGKVFNRHAQVIKLPAGSSEAAYLGLLGILNSSVTCFWLKQVSFNKGDSTDARGARTTGDPAFDTYEYGASMVGKLPLVESRPVELAKKIDALATDVASKLPTALGGLAPNSTFGAVLNRSVLNAARDQVDSLRRQMIATQEELDWRCYRLYSLLPVGVSADELEFQAPVEVALGERAFEIVLARRLAAGEEKTTWFERHGFAPTTEIPSRWPEAFRRVVARRIQLIEHDKTIGLIERPEFKRRWNSPRWEHLEKDALRHWLLARLETAALWPASSEQPPQLSSTSRLAESVLSDSEFMQIAALYTDHSDFDLPQLVAELVAGESVPALPVQRYAESGLRKRAQWQETWALQRQEDAIDATVDACAKVRREELMQAATKVSNGVALDAEALKWVEETLTQEFTPLRKERKTREIGTIPVPPKYQSKDFLRADFWRLRGGLDVPKERWISYPGCERGSDGSLVIAWAGWNHLQQATALAGYYMDMKDSEGWEPARLQPLLASLLELLPWLEQWHNELDPVFGEHMGDYYRGFVTEEARALGFTLDDLRAWKPETTAAKRGRKKKVTL